MIISVISALPELGSRNLVPENDTRSLNDQERDNERVRIEQRFNVMNRQKRELTSLVRMLSEKNTSNNPEENGNNTHQTRTPSHSDTHE